MTYLAVAVTGTAALSALNFLLLLLVVRRVRGYREQLARQRGPLRQLPGLPVGTQVPDFTVRGNSGEAIRLDSLRGARSLVAFFSPDCRPCQEQAPELAAFARATAQEPSRIVAVICGDKGHEGAASIAAELAGAATVVHEQVGGPAEAAFSVSGYPSFYLLDDGGRVQASGHTVHSVAAAHSR
jgi:thiol-disulfide isomerase/thioredoxin